MGNLDAGRGPGDRVAEWMWLRHTGSRLLGMKGRLGPYEETLPAEAPSVHLLTSAFASSRAFSWLGKTAAPPNFTSITSADRFSTTFLLRMEAVREAEGAWVQESLCFLRDAEHLALRSGMSQGL